MSGFAWTDGQVRQALGLGEEARRPAAAPYGRISTDSRDIRPGDLFLALVGDRFDGHDFVETAVAAGAGGVVASRPVDVDVPVYLVPDTLTALGRLARHRRRALPARVVGITGSSGKTTAKELARGAMAATLRVHATRGNLNNQVGVPLTLLAAPEDAQVLVVEMGTNEPGEIAILTGIAEPEVGIVTTVGETHLEKLGTVAGVLDEKLDLLRGLAPDGTAVVGDAPPALPREARRIRPGVRVAGWGADADADLRPMDAVADDRGCWSFTWKGVRVALAVPGRHSVLNALLALCAAEAVGVAPADAARGLASVGPSDMRGEVRRMGGLTLVVDCYNANPQSVRAALDLLTTLPAPGGRVAVLGSMLELGDLSPRLHADVLADALEQPLDLVVATGAFAEAARAMAPARRDEVGRRLLVADDPVAAYPALAGRLAAGQAVLLKASRGVKMERILEPLQRDFGNGEGEAA